MHSGGSRAQVRGMPPHENMWPKALARPGIQEPPEAPGNFAGFISPEMHSGLSEQVIFEILMF